MTLHVVALLCSLALAPGECDRSTAIDVIPLGESNSPVMCALEGQMTLAGLALRADAEHRWVVKCQRTSIGRGDVG